MLWQNFIEISPKNGVIMATERGYMAMNLNLMCGRISSEYFNHFSFELLNNLGLKSRNNLSEVSNDRRVIDCWLCFANE